MLKHLQLFCMTMNDYDYMNDYELNLFGHIINTRNHNNVHKQ